MSPATRYAHLPELIGVIHQVAQRLGAIGRTSEVATGTTRRPTIEGVIVNQDRGTGAERFDEGRVCPANLMAVDVESRVEPQAVDRVLVVGRSYLEKRPPRRLR